MVYSFVCTCTRTSVVLNGPPAAAEGSRAHRAATDVMALGISARRGRRQSRCLGRYTTLRFPYDLSPINITAFTMAQISRALSCNGRISRKHNVFIRRDGDLGTEVTSGETAASRIAREETSGRDRANFKTTCSPASRDFSSPARYETMPPCAKILGTIKNESR
jgi:hypothetical protein